MDEDALSVEGDRYRLFLRGGEEEGENDLLRSGDDDGDLYRLLEFEVIVDFCNKLVLLLFLLLLLLLMMDELKSPILSCCKAYCCKSSNCFSFSFLNLSLASDCTVFVYLF